VSDHQTRRLSFGSVAADYARYRPGPPPQALDWLIPAGPLAVLDLAAGTGAVTAELAGRAPRVIAVEPDERMRAILTASCPRAEVLAGRGEDIPLPDASVDAVVISAASHWLDPDRAVPEITRVLRVGGVLGVLWVTPGTCGCPGSRSSVRWPARHPRPAASRAAGGRPSPPGDRVPAGHAAVPHGAAHGRVLAADDQG
jgi:SAM-dependent methyltransferase